ncbi:nucleotidyltransferase, putative [Plasmodium ovale]|uniref:Nucleotidyltransferase, putative n=1 Tax=Plasmodium ovale TaxID=36330 RepID=A0A1C3L5M2_PLAOA|nr:nucleotidyltransferase, putative [Plasmodium ovale]
MEGVRAITHFNVYAKRAHSIHGIKIQNQERKKYLFEIWLKRKEDNSLYGNLDKWGYIKRNIHSYDKGNKGKFIQRGDDFTGENISIETKCKKKEVAGFIYKMKKTVCRQTFCRNFASLANFTSSKCKENNKICLTNDFLNKTNLKKEISDIHKKLTENSFIDKKKEEIYFLLKSAIKPNLKGKIYFVGSCENNIWIKNSDIDCCIVVENCEDKNSYLYILKVIKSAINLIYPSLTVNIIKASVPIAKIYEEQNNICDISINNTVAIVNTQFVASLCNMDERITIINRIIKYWAKQKNINNRSQGTFSSYALFLLTYFFFQNLETPLLPSYKSIERANAASFEINSEYFFLQDEVQMPFYTSIEDIKTKFQNFKKNEEDVSKLLYGFFEFYSNDICKNGITLDIYNNQIIENKDMTANIYCPITKKIVNTYSINTWKKIYDKIHAAYDKLKDITC